MVGVQCSGSDAFSGVTANPAVGFCTDLLVRAGARVMCSETTEVRDGIGQLTARQHARSGRTHDPREGLVRSANTTLGNKKAAWDEQGMKRRHGGRRPDPHSIPQLREEIPWCLEARTVTLRRATL